MQAVGGQPNHRIARLDLFPIQNLRFFNDSHNSAANVVLAELIKPRHLRRLAANEGAMVFAAGFGKASDNLAEDPWFEFSGADVIEKEKRLGAEHSYVIYTMIDEILADGVVAIQ